MIYFKTESEGGSPRWLCDYQSLLVNAFVDIEDTGFPFDPYAHQQFITKTEQINAEYEAKLLAYPDLVRYSNLVGLTEPFNLSSPTQLKKFLFGGKSHGGLELVPVKRSKLTDSASTDRESLQHFAQEGNEFCANLLVLRNLGKLLSSFGSPLLKFYCERSGALHPVYFLAKVLDGAGVSGGTATGRLSCKHPNMQQLPKRDKDEKGIGLAGIDVRKSFVPFPGHVLAEFDQSQIEVRVAGMYAKDTTMGKFFKEGGDFHIRVASRVFKKDYDQMVKVLSDDKHPSYKAFKKLRTAAKTFTFGLMFGMGLNKLTKQSGLTEAEGTEFIDEYFATFPQFAAWREDMIDWATEYGWVQTLFGRKRTIKISGYETEDGREERIGINTPIQSAAADITLYGLARIWEFLTANDYGAKILGTVHDSIIFSIPLDEVNEVCPRIASMMIHPPGMEWLLDEVPVPLSVGVDIGANWRDMSSLDLDEVLTGSIDVREHI